MSIIQQIREKYAAVGFGAIALSLIAFILMDANQRGSGGGVSGDRANSGTAKRDGLRHAREKFDLPGLGVRTPGDRGRFVDSRLRRVV